MKTCLEIFLVALVTIYIVDVSGFTQSWRSALAKALNVKTLRPLPPFDCAKCMTWWVCLIYSIITHTITLPVVAFCAFMSYLAYPIGLFFQALKERILININRIFP